MTTLLPSDDAPLASAHKFLLVKVLAITVAVLVLYSVFLWWSLSPHSQANNNDPSLAQLRLQRGAELPEQPQGDLFVIGRERLDEDAAENISESETKDKAGDYALLAVLTIGKTYYALFDNGAEQQKLTLGDILPGSGVINHIDRRQVKIANPDAKNGEQQFMLFPVLHPKGESDPELTPDAEIDKM